MLILQQNAAKYSVYIKNSIFSFRFLESRISSLRRYNCILVPNKTQRQVFYDFLGTNFMLFVHEKLIHPVILSSKYLNGVFSKHIEGTHAELIENSKSFQPIVYTYFYWIRFPYITYKVLQCINFRIHYKEIKKKIKTNLQNRNDFKFTQFFFLIIFVVFIKYIQVIQIVRKTVVQY